LKYVYRHSADGIDENLLILFHGLGDKAGNFVNFGIKMNLPQTAVMAIQGPDKIPFFEESEVGTGWWPAYDPVTGDDLPVTSKVALDGIRKTRKLLTEFLDKLGKVWLPGNIFLFGFSQGGSCALDLALRSSTGRVGGIVSVAGWLEEERHLNDAKVELFNNKGIKVLIIQGNKDERIAMSLASKKVSMYAPSLHQV
jgi:predicted esterase